MASTDLVIRSPASASRSSMMLMCDHQRSDSLTGHYLVDVRSARHVEDDDGQVVVHTQGKRGRVHDLKPARERIPVCDLGDELGLRMSGWVGGVDAFDSVLGHQHHLGVELGGAKRG